MRGKGDSMHNTKFRQMITPPSANEFDERYRFISNQAFKEMTTSVLVAVVIITMALQVPQLHAYNHLVLSFLPALIIVLSVVAYTVARIRHGGWSWSVMRWNAWMLLLLSPFLIAITIMPTVSSSGGFNALMLIPAILYLLVPIAIIVLSLYHPEESDENTNNTRRGLLALVSIGIVSLILTAVTILLSLPGVHLAGLAITLTPTVSTGIAFLIGGILCLLIPIARQSNMALPYYLQNASELSAADKTRVNRRMSGMAAFIIILSVLFILSGINAH